MIRRKDYEIELAKIAGVLRGRKGHTQEEIDAIGKNIPIMVMKDARLFAQYAQNNDLNITDCLILTTWFSNMADFLGDVRVKTDISYDQTVKCFEQARVNTIVIHRLNYILHESMIQVYDILERDNKVRFSVKKALNETEKPWNVYCNDRRKIIEKTAWYTMQDHLRLASDAVSPYIEKVYEAIRDNMIYLGYRDVELKARCAVVFLIGKVVGHSYNAFFRSFEEESGVDFSVCFEDDNLYGMVGKFADLCSTLGIKTQKDEFGFYALEGFDPESNNRFSTAWDSLIGVLRDDDLMDEMAQKAISLNPGMQEEYGKILEMEEQKEMDLGLEQLSEKYKVKRL